MLNNSLIIQLTELAKAFQQRDIKPIICGGLGVYLSSCTKESPITQMIRATQDVDLVFSKQDLIDQSKRNAMAEVIVGELEYIVQDKKRYHGFRKDPGLELDILVPDVAELPHDNYRLKLVKSTLHGHIAEEAEFIDEDLQIIFLSDISRKFADKTDIKIYVPCTTNLMIMKLYAFRDRIEGKRDNPERAMAHAFDIYIVIMLTDIRDIKKAQTFLSRHEDSTIIKEAKEIVKDSFSMCEKIGWQTVLESPLFYPTLSVAQRRDKLQKASERLLRWFDLKL